MPTLLHSPAPVNTGAPPATPPPCSCGGDVLLYREAGLPPVLVCIDCHDLQFADYPHPVTEG